MPQVSVEQLFIYPVKSCAGIELSEAELTPEGLLWDRSWMVINADGKFVSQRQLPQMARIHIDFSEQALILAYAPESTSVEYNNPEFFSVDLNPPLGDAITAHIWNDACQVLDEGRAVGDWLTRVLNSPQPLRLVCMAGDSVRPQSQPERFGANTHTQFADAAPFLVTNTTSLHVLNQQLQRDQLDQVDMRHFRPNIVIAGLDAFAEQQVLRLEHPDYTLQLCDRSSRCVMTTVNPDTGIKHPQQVPFKTLTTLNPMPTNSRMPAFGMNTTLISKIDEVPVIRCGDKLDVVFTPQ